MHLVTYDGATVSHVLADWQDPEDRYEDALCGRGPWPGEWQISGHPLTGSTHPLCVQCQAVLFHQHQRY